MAYERRDRSAVKQHLDIPRRLIRTLASDINLPLTRRVDRDRRNLGEHVTHRAVPLLLDLFLIHDDDFFRVPETLDFNVFGRDHGVCEFHGARVGGLEFRFGRHGTRCRDA